VNRTGLPNDLAGARRQIALQTPQLILLDLQLPDGSGMSLLDDEQVRAVVPAGRRGTVEEIASAVRYLASDEASIVSGVCIEVDGARCA